MSVTCPLCGAEMVVRSTLKFTYADGRPRKFLGCSNWPDCTATHGCHPDGTPLGVPADDETKRARIAAHNAFDQIWKKPGGIMTRKEAYAWLARSLKQDEVHIGELDLVGCGEVVELVRDMGVGGEA